MEALESSNQNPLSITTWSWRTVGSFHRNRRRKPVMKLSESLKLPAPLRNGVRGDSARFLEITESKRFMESLEIAKPLSSKLMGGGGCGKFDQNLEPRGRHVVEWGIDITRLLVMELSEAVASLINNTHPKCKMFGGRLTTRPLIYNGVRKGVGFLLGRAYGDAPWSRWENKIGMQDSVWSWWGV